VSAAVRLAEAGDAALVAGLMADFRDWQGRTQPSDAALHHRVERLIVDPGAEYLLAITGGEAEGVCQLRYRYGLWHTAEDCWLEDLFVRERARALGLGRALVEAAMERARTRGCRRIELDADSDNETALALYKQAGFTAETASGARRLMLRLALPGS
jgi:GNAT superfamily N-acetyltransferase